MMSYFNRYIRAFTLSTVLTTSSLSGCSAPLIQHHQNTSSPPALEKDVFITSDGYRLPFLTPTSWPTNPKALLVALHGFNDYSRAFEGMCTYMNKLSIACIAYDQRGFGATKYRGIWPGDGVMESDLLELIETIEKAYPQTPVYLVGESMGGAVIISALATTELSEKKSLSGAILLAPAIWARDTQPWYQRWALALAVRIAPSWKPTGESLDIIATDNIEALRAMGRDELIIKETRIDAVYGLTNLMDKALELSPHLTTPTMILYGEKDEVIPRAPTCRMLEKLNEAELHYTLRLYPNGYHMLTRDLQAETVFDDIYQWIENDTSQPATMSRDSLCAS
jgi:alpha-beta hydrolase superfamily lysophospholipase